MRHFTIAISLIAAFMGAYAQQGRVMRAPGPGGDQVEYFRWLRTAEPVEDPQAVLEAKKQIDALYAKNDREALKQIVSKAFRAAMNKKEGRRLAVFRWIYAGQLSKYPDVGNFEGSSLATTALNWERPAGYEELRAQYLLYAGQQYPGFVPLGRRLLKVKPHDFRVEYVQVNQLLSFTDISSRDAALAAATNLAKKYPQKGYASALAGFAHFAEGRVRRDGQLLRIAEKHYRRALELIPSNDPYRVDVEKTLKQIPQLIKHFE